MPYRVKADGSIECDSVEEALTLRQAMLQKPVAKARTQRGVRATASELKFDANKRRFVECLLASQTALTSDAIAEYLELAPKSLPPVVRGLRNWAKRHGHEFASLIEQRSKNVAGKVVGTYRLSDEGREVFQKELNEPAHDRAAI